MKKNQFLSILLLLIFVVQSIPNSILIIPVSAAEYENIDSFNVHPTNRYDTALTTSTETITVNNSILDYIDQGGVGESSAISRQLSKTDFKIDGRVKTPDVLEGNYSEFPVYTDLIGDFEAYFPLNEGTGTAYDNKHTTNPDGNGVNTPTWTSSFNQYTESNFALDFERDTFEYFTSIDDPDYSFTDGAGTDKPFSISAWIKMESTSAAQYVIMGKYLPAGNNVEYLFYVFSGVLWFICYSGGTTGNFIRITSNVLELDNWYFVTCVYDGTELASGLDMYVDGVLNVDARATVGTYTGMIDGTAALEISSLQNGAGGYFDGVIDEPILWNLAMDAGEVISIYDDYIYNENADMRSIIGLEDFTETLDLSTIGLGIEFEVLSESDENCLVYYSYEGINDVVYQTNFFNVTQNTWFRFKIDIDILRSEFDIEFSFDNGTDIDDSEKTNLDISTVMPRIFSSDTLNLVFGNEFDLNGTIEFQLDFVKGPFEEFQWKEDSALFTGTQNWFKSYNEFGATIDAPNGAQGINFESVGYCYTVPSLDAITGVLYASVNQTVEDDVDDFVVISAISIVPVVANNGTTGNDLQIRLTYPAAISYPKVSIYIDTIEIYSRRFDPTLTIFHDKVEIPFTFYITPNKVGILQVNIMGEIHSWEKDLTEYSDEFNIRSLYRLDYFNNPSTQNATYSTGIRDFEPIYRDLFGLPPIIADLLPDDPVGAAVQGTTNILMQGFRLIGSVVDGLSTALLSPIMLISTVISGISGVINTISSLVSGIPTAAATAFTTIIGAVKTAVDGVELAVDLVTDAVDDVTTAITELPALISTALESLFTSLEGALDELEAIVTALGVGIWTAIIDQLSAIFDEIITVLALVLDDIVDLVGAFGDLLWDTLVEPVLPGITALFDLTIGTLFDLIGWVQTAIDGIIAFSPLVMVAITCWLFLLPAFSSDDGGQWVDQMADRLFRDLVGGRFAVVGITVPVPMIMPYFVATLFFGFVWF